MKIYSLAILLAFYVHPSTAQELDIKGFRLGADIKESTRIGGFYCSPMTGAIGLTCVTGLPGLPDSIASIAGIQTRNIFVTGYDGKIGEVTFTFAQFNFDIVRTAFQSTYGPLTCVESVVTNALRVSFDQTICTAQIRDTTLVIQRRGPDLKDGSVKVVSADFLRTNAEHIKASKDAAKKDI